MARRYVMLNNSYYYVGESEDMTEAENITMFPYFS